MGLPQPRVDEEFPPAALLLAENERLKRELAVARIKSAIGTMRRFDKIRVPYFQDLLAQARRKKLKADEAREIERIPGNPMLRHTAQQALALNEITEPTVEIKK